MTHPQKKDVSQPSVGALSVVLILLTRRWRCLFVSGNYHFDLETLFQTVQHTAGPFSGGPVVVKYLLHTHSTTLIFIFLPSPLCHSHFVRGART
jgi:hypothetical protein